MPFLCVTVEVSRRDTQALETLLFELGAASVTLLDAADDPVLEPAPGETPLWSIVRIRALFAPDAHRAGIEHALRAATHGGLGVEFGELGDRAWEREWLADFKPMRFGRRLWICPGGQDVQAADAVRVELDPGLAFGTGTHPTTAMCLEWLESRDLAGRIVVDYGSGSGVLGIAALKLGARHVHAIDIDPQAQLATRQNAERNRVDDRLTIGAPPTGIAAVLVANILAGPLIDLALSISRLVAPRGEIALSGILADQAEAVTAAYRACFDIGLEGLRDDWALLGGRRIA